MGLLVNVYTAKGRNMDCTRNGVTNRYDQLCVINIKGPFKPSDDCPAVILEKGPFNSVRLVPLEIKDSWTMFGGNYAGTSDSRFGDAVEKFIGDHFYGAVAVHDRVED